MYKLCYDYYKCFLKSKPMIKKIALNFFCLFSFLLLFSGKPAFNRETDGPVIKAGIARLSGKITAPNNNKMDSTVVSVSVLHPISGETVKYTALTDKSGQFSLDMDVELDVSPIGLSTSLNPEKFLFAQVDVNRITNITMSYNARYEIETLDVTPAVNKEDLTRSFDLRDKMIAYRSGRSAESLYDKSTGHFLDFAKNSLSERLMILEKDTLISAQAKALLAKDFRLILYSTFIFDYEGYMVLNYQTLNGDKPKEDLIQKIDKTYYRFLKDFNLNDPQYLQCFTFPDFQKEILQNEVIGLPEIGESDIPSWLTQVKATLSDLIGFDEGPYYAILAANAYARQLNEEVRPLSEKQRKNIENYWKDGDIAKILFRKNQQVEALHKENMPVVVHDISQVPDDQVIETILAKYKNKVVLIDLWATWCVPCLNAMQEFRDTKHEFQAKDVVFVYLTNGSSPRKLWQEKIKGIGNEHYYLTGSQWEHLMERYDFEAIPSYLLFNKARTLVQHFTGFPGNDTMKEMMKNAL